MARRSPLDFDISVAADKRRRARERGLTGKLASGERACDWPGCGSGAEYRAPASPRELDRFRWFCLDHVRAYNLAWNYFDGWSEEEVAAQWRADVTWERPTWTLGKGPINGVRIGGHAEGRAWERHGVRDPLELLGDAATLNPGPPPGEPPRRRLTRQEQQAMDELGLPHQVESRAELRARYRALVKDLHPDMNGGERRDEGRLARVIRAWDILKASRNFVD